MRYDFNPDLKRAFTLPSIWYTTPQVWESEQKNLWRRTWQLVGRSENLKEPGQYMTCKVGRENLVLVNDRGAIRAFSSVCRHRAGPVATSCGQVTKFKCKYHGWTYSLDGRLSMAPEFTGVENFDPKDVQLPKWEVSTWGPLVFVSQNPLMSFSEFMGSIPEQAREFQPERMKHFLTKDYVVKCNWKIYVDNYLEGYHLASVHPTLSRELDYSQYVVQTFKWHSSQKAPAKSTAKLYAEGEQPGAHYFWLFPNLMLNIYQGMVQTNVVIPVSINECTVRFEWYLDSDRFEDVKAKMPELIEFSDQIQEEDRQICEAVQDNLLSENYNQGRYSVKRENGVHHFHGLLSQLMA